MQIFPRKRTISLSLVRPPPRWSTTSQVVAENIRGYSSCVFYSEASSIDSYSTAAAAADLYFTLGSHIHRTPPECMCMCCSYVNYKRFLGFHG